MNSPVLLAVDLAVRQAPVAACFRLAELVAYQPLSVVNGAFVKLHVGLAQRPKLARVAFELLQNWLHSFLTQSGACCMNYIPFLISRVT